MEKPKVWMETCSREGGKSEGEQGHRKPGGEMNVSERGGADAHCHWHSCQNAGPCSGSHASWGCAALNLDSLLA